MKKTVIITEKAADLLVVPECDAEIIVTGSAAEEADKRHDSIQEGEECRPLIFCTENEIPSLKKQDYIHHCVLILNKDTFVKDSPSVQGWYEVKIGRMEEIEVFSLVERYFTDCEWKLKQIHKDDKYKFAIRDARNDQESLIDIGQALSLEKNPDHLFRLILRLSKKITGADAGSIFITEGEEEKVLRFKYSHTFSKELAYEEFVLPLDTNSIAGYVAVTGEVLNIRDVYKLEKEDPVSFNPSFDKKHGYRTKSMLVVPMRNHLDEIIGVIQLINSKEADDRYTGNEAFEVVLETEEDFKDKVIPFKKRYENLMQAVASQAAIAIENNRMLKQIEHQFEEFVRASVTAIESRDPATSGHSFRVAAMCVRLAEAINSVQSGQFARIHFSDTQIKEFEFAGLLHDFGKVYLDPNIFLKSKKLFEKDFNYLLLRLKYLYRSLELQYEEKQDHETLNKKLALIKEIMGTITELNEPKVRQDNPEEIIQHILENGDLLNAVDLSGEPIPLLTDFEITNLNIRKGSLNDEERKIIESHVEHTYAFVSKIPWPDEYRNIPEIALRHHEKLDGSGYPKRVKGKESIPIQSRIIVITDIFDALMASDRPYKTSIPLDRVLDILTEEAEDGKLDIDLVELFIENRTWEACDYQIR